MSGSWVQGRWATRMPPPGLLQLPTVKAEINREWRVGREKLWRCGSQEQSLRDRGLPVATSSQDVTPIAFGGIGVLFLFVLLTFTRKERKPKRRQLYLFLGEKSTGTMPGSWVQGRWARMPPKEADQPKY
ncbi:hypothetical protein GGX14DRAFT_404089 [Mycena pura]|uniref:Uncharacterized protein n=1 Tax=Mycena pura TaxID=153505 RepID=A0AAD6UVJ9_9AGAR|nr:hypothetical protein GGX14DRAFT_404089 [Mycena pura]